MGEALVTVVGALLQGEIRFFSTGIRRGVAPFKKFLPSPLMKGRGIKSEGLENNRYKGFW